MGNMLMFDTNKLTAKAGKVTINFTNNSALQHDVVLVELRKQDRRQDTDLR